MSELDLGLKVGVRRLFWSMGYSTRIDVQLRGFNPPPDASRRSRSPEMFTDLDVLGIAVTGGHRLSTEIADCKTSSRDSTSRMFWVRGVADLFGADHAYLVREHNVTDAARQLSARLGITVLPGEDLLHMQKQYESALLGEQSHISILERGPLSVLFEQDAVAAQLAAFNGLDRQLKRLLDYRNFDYWVYEEHRNPVQLVAHLAGAREYLDSRNPIHLSLFLDLSWLYLLSLIRVASHVRGAFLGDPDRGLQEYIFGGPINLQEKRETARLLQSTRPKKAELLDHLPPYYSQLRELLIRLLRRPNHMQQALRYAEAASALAAVKSRFGLYGAMGHDENRNSFFHILPAKLVGDVCGFLVAAANLDSGFRSMARMYLLDEDPKVPQSSSATRVYSQDSNLQGMNSSTPSGGGQIPLVEVEESSKTADRETGLPGGGA